MAGSRLRHAAVAAVLAMVVPGVPSVAAPAAPARAHASAAADRATGFWSRLARQRGERGEPDVVAAWRGATGDALKRRTPIATVGSPLGTKAAAAAPTATYDSVGLAGDLDGDRHDDAVVLSETYRTSGAPGVERIGVEARRGATGARLWSATVTPPKVVCEHDGCGNVFAYGAAYPATVAGADGVEIVVVRMLIDSLYVDDPSSGWPVLQVPDWSYVFVFDVIHLDRHGRRTADRHLEGRVRMDDYVMRFEHVPVVVDASQDIEPGAEWDWVYTETQGTYVAPLAVTGRAGLTTTRVMVLDGHDGSLREITRREVYPPEDADVVGDVSGDRVDDLVLHPAWAWSADEAPPGAEVTAVSSGGHVLWRRPAGHGNVFAGWAGDTTGNGGVDLLVFTTPFPRDEKPAPVPALLLDGTTGGVLWQRVADAAYPLGDVDRDRRAEVAVVTWARNGGTVTIDVTAYDGRNQRSYTRRLTVAGGTAAHTAGAFAGDVGDLDGDRVPDLGVGVVTVTTTRTGNSVTTSVRYVPLAYLAGRSGRSLPRIANTSSLYGSVDGRGDDLITRETRGVRLRDGRTGKSLLHVDVGVPLRYAWAEPGAVDGDRCPDLLVSAYPSSGLVFGVVSGATGRTRWQATRGNVGKPRITASQRAYRCRP